MIKFATVEDVCELITDGTHYTPKNLGSGIPFLTVKDITNLELDFTNCSFISEIDYQTAKFGNSAPQKGDILFSKDGTVGKVHIVNTDNPFAVLSSLAILRPNKKLIESQYLGNVLRLPLVLDDALKRKTGSAIRRIILADLKRVRFPLPSLEEQKRIAEILDRSQFLISKRQEAIALLDSLTQAIFIEMFGDPVKNPKGWKTIVLGDVITSASDGPHVSPKYADSGIPFLSTRHIQRGKINWTDLKFISLDEAEIQWKKCRPQRGDILYTKGGTTGIAATVDFDEPFAVWVHVALLKTDKNKVEPKWLENMLNCAFCYQQSQRLTHGIANRDLGLKRMVGIEMFLPPLPLQKEFAQRVEAVEKLKATHRASLTELQALFASLQHRAFRGEL